MIRVAVTGAHGRMGTLVVQLIQQEEDMQLVAVIDPRGVGEKVGDLKIIHPDEMGRAFGETAPHVLIDFTAADAAVRNIEVAVDHGVNLVVGTTGFSNEQMEKIRRTIGNRVAAVISPNFSVGANVMWRLCQIAARCLKGYQVEIVEAHHRMKRDAPSGTALRAAEMISSETGGRISTGTRKDASEICIHSIRGGDIVGDHTIIFIADGERVEITHRAHSRLAFAQGAVRAARWVVNAPKGIHTMEEVLFT